MEETSAAFAIFVPTSEECLPKSKTGHSDASNIKYNNYCNPTLCVPVLKAFRLISPGFICR